MLSSFEIFRQRKNEVEEPPVMVEQRKGTVQSHFLDSGSFTLWTKAGEWAKENGKSKWDYYDTDEFWKYMDDYAAFVKKYQIAIDLYANVDVIPNPKLSWRNLKYLEREHGLTPVPVVHYTTHLKWLRRHIEVGYKVIGLGGLVGSTRQESCRGWLDQAFDMVCDAPDRLPRVKIHGFGVTNYPLLVRYPWWSVDSVTWAKQGGFGCILVPHKRGGRFVFDTPPYSVKISIECAARKEKGNHFLTMAGAERAIIEEWLELIGIPLGKQEGEEIVEYGVLNRHTERRAACLHFFERMRTSLPEWPWPFRGTVRRGFGVA